MWREQDAWNIEPQHVFFNPYQRPICDEAFFKKVGNGFDIWQDSKYVCIYPQHNDRENVQVQIYPSLCSDSKMLRVVEKCF